MQRHRTVIPAQNVEAITIGPYRVTLRRWEHVQGGTPTYAIEVWDGWIRQSHEEIIGERNAMARWGETPAEVAVLVARRALGLEKQ